MTSRNQQKMMSSWGESNAIDYKLHHMWWLPIGATVERHPAKPVDMENISPFTQCLIKIIKKTHKQMAQDCTSTGLWSGTPLEFFASQMQAPKFLPYLTTAIGLEKERLSFWQKKTIEMLQLLTHDHFEFITCESLRCKSSFNKKNNKPWWHDRVRVLEVPTSYWDIKWWHVLTRCQGAGRNWRFPYVSHQRHHKIPSDHWRSHLKIQGVHIWDDVS